VPTQRIAQDREDIALDVCRLLAFGDSDRPSPRHDPLVWIQPDERVTAHLLAAFHRLQQKALALLPRGAQKRRHRRLQVRHQSAVYGNQGVGFGELQELFAAGVCLFR